MHASAAFKETAKKAQPFFNALKDFAFSQDLSLENAYNVCLVETPMLRFSHTDPIFEQVWDFVSSSLIHNKTYAHRLPPTFLEQARGLANMRENLVFSDSSRGGIGNSE